MFTARRDVRKPAGEDASMDEILASIRRIISEDVLDPRDQPRRSAGALRPPSARAVPPGEPMPRPAARSVPPLAVGRAAIGAPADDDVLAELLEAPPEARAARPAVTPSPAPNPPVRQPASDVGTFPRTQAPVTAAPVEAPLEASREVSLAARATPAPPIHVAPELTPVAASQAFLSEPSAVAAEVARSEPVAPAASAAAPVAEPSAPEHVEPTLVSVAEDEIRRAQDALGALAAGLAAFTMVAPVEANTTPPAAVAVVDAPANSGAQPTETVEPAASAPDSTGPSPATAAAEAVAAVAAANAAAAHGGPRQTAAASQGRTADPAADTAPAAEDKPAPAVPAAVARDVNPTDEPSPVQASPTDAPAATAPVEAATPSAVPSAVPQAPVPTPAAAAAGGGAAGLLVPVQPSQSFEDAIATMLRPLLREWLNAHLPRMVEKALRDELAQSGALAAPLPADVKPA